MGIIGAAVASGLGQVLSVLVLLSHFVQKKGALRIKAFKIDFLLVKKHASAGCRPCADGISSFATVQPVFYPHGIESDLYSISFLHQKNRRSKCHSDQQGYYCEIACHFLYSHTLWK